MGKNHVQVSPFDLTMNNVSCKKVCDVNLSNSEVVNLKRLIRHQYTIDLSLDGLPVHMSDTNGNSFRGVTLVSKLHNEATDDLQFFYHNHFRFTILYNRDEIYDGSQRIVGLQVNKAPQRSDR